MSNNYIVWRGRDSRDIDGLMITSLPAISRPAMRVEKTEIDGRAGSIIENLGYESYDRMIMIGLHGEYDIDAVIDYFTGAGTLVCSNEEEREYTAQIIDQIDYERLIRFRTAKVKFHVQPYKHIAGEGLRKYTANPAKVANLGYETALPLIHMKGTGTVEFYVNDTSIFKYTFDSAGEVYIDSEAQDAYLGDVLKNRNMIGNFPILKSGANNISYKGTLSLLEIKTNTRYL